MSFLTFEPVPPAFDELDPATYLFHYDRVSDSLLVYFDGVARPAVTLDVDDYLSFRVDPESHRIIGIQVDGFLGHAVFDDPQLLVMAEWAGIDTAELDCIRRRIEPNSIKQAILRSLITRFRATA